MSVALQSPPVPRVKPADNPLMTGFRMLASLRLTVVLLALSIILVFVGTLAQIDGGIWTIVRDYFRSFVVWMPFQLFIQLGQVFIGFPTDWRLPEYFELPRLRISIPTSFPFPGGWTIGALMLLNLFAAHALRFRLSWKKLGVITIHAGVVVLMLGELAAGTMQTESRMTVGHGETVGFVENSRVTELALIDVSDPKENVEVTIPERMLRNKKLKRISDPQLPVDIEVVEFFPNSELIAPKQGEPAGADVFVSTMGAAFTFQGKNEASGVETGSHEDAVSARVKFLEKGTDKVIATKLVSLWFSPNFTRRLPVYQFQPQEITVGGKTYRVEPRGVHEYLPFTLRLNEFRFDRYPGTNTPRNYSSRVTLTDARFQSERDLLIRMNEPLTYDGATYYQSGFTPDEKGTVLQVTRNPGVWLPYISCLMVAGGMLLHFGIKLSQFLPKTSGVKFSLLRLALSGAAIAAVLLAQYAVTRPARLTSSGFDFDAFGRLPVQDGGRVKPLDTAARVALTIINSRQSCTDAAGQKLSPSQWLIEVMALRPQALTSNLAQTRLFRIDNDALVKSLGLEPRPGFWRYSLAEVAPQLAEIQRLADKAGDIDARHREVIDQKTLDLHRHLGEFLKINSGRLAVLPPESGSPQEEWRNYGDFTAEGIETQALNNLKQRAARGEFMPKDLTEEQFVAMIRAERAQIAAATPPAARDFLAIIDAYRGGNVREFNAAVTTYADKYSDRLPAEMTRHVALETTYNRAAVFYYSIYFYLIAFLFVLIGWIVTSVDGGNLSATFIAIGSAIGGATLSMHLVAMLMRMYLMDRPLVFVTNLYSSAIFIAAAAMVMGLIIELLYRKGIGTALGCAAAGAGLVVGYSIDLGMEGDKLEMMQAVLDTNFWLATHVTCVTIGYAATMLAGIVGIVFVGLGIITPLLNRDLTKILASLIYGIICFATLFSFTGTILGGIWADYSWGRFWGWDPKENGAMLIVLWNVLVLHARWGGLVKSRGVAVLSIAGIAVTAWSWFGTNQLGVGLHSYGFTSAAATAITSLVVFVAACVCVGALVPENKWLSRTPQTA